MSRSNRTLRMNLQLLKSGKWAQIRHPDYDAAWAEWQKYRYTMKGGEDFVEEYLEMFSLRESPTDFENRKEFSPCAAVAKSAIREVKNSVYSRMRDIARKNGSDDYNKSIEGENGGVDRLGRSMNAFMGDFVIEELLAMSKVGIFVDKDRINAASRNKVLARKPYLYVYTTEQILNWKFNEETHELEAVLLADNIYEYEGEHNFPSAAGEQYRHIYMAEDGVVIDVYNDKDVRTDHVVLSNMKRIPFVIVEITESLLTDIADYQIALTNMESSDIDYALKSNFPFYTEQRRPNARDFMRPPSQDESSTGDAGTATAAATAREDEVTVGHAKGRAYGPEMDRPGFINPSPDPLRASMEKQEKIKETVKQLLHLAVSNLRPTRQATDSKKIDQEGLESGLAAVGTALEYAEREIAKIWAMYQGDENVAYISYPKDYSLKSDDERVSEANKFSELIGKIPSKTYQKEVSKLIADILLKGKIDFETLETIHSEIDNADIVDINPINLLEDIREGLVTRKSASKARLYADDEAEKAETEHAERLKRINISQTSGDGNNAQGVQDLDSENKSSTKGDE